MIWERLIRLEKDMLEVLERDMTEYNEPGMERFNKEGWTNRTFKNKYVRRAHVDVVDARDTKRLWMAHICLFPNTTNGGPIYGFDVIAGENKITGCFHDFSPLLQKDHPLTEYFVEETKWFKPSKRRELPEWATKIFSRGMIAAANIREFKELNQICELAVSNLYSYLDKIRDWDNTAKPEAVIEAQNYYCEHQAQNPHTPRVMLSLGLPEEDVKIFNENNLWPKIN